MGWFNRQPAIHILKPEMHFEKPHPFLEKIFIKFQGLFVFITNWSSFSRIMARQPTPPPDGSSSKLIGFIRTTLKKFKGKKWCSNLLKILQFLILSELISQLVCFSLLSYSFSLLEKWLRITLPKTNISLPKGRRWFFFSHNEIC